MRTGAILLLASSLIAGCGGPTPSADPPTTDVTVSSTSTTVPTPTTAWDTSSTTSTAEPATTVPTTATSTTTAGIEGPFREDGTLRALPATESLRPPTGLRAVDVRWESVGPGWILTGVWSGSGSLVDPFHQDLYLIDPTDRVYLLGGWDPDLVLQDWSPDGLRIVHTGGPSEHDTAVLHLLEGSVADIRTAYRPQVARFTRPTGREVVIGRLWGEQSIIDVHRTNGALWSHLLEEVASAEPGDYHVGPGWLYHESGTQVVVSDSDAVWLMDNLGGSIHRLRVDGIHCAVRRWWSEDEALVACTDPQYADTEIYGCWPNTGRELWAVPIDGSAPRPVGPQAGAGGRCDGQGDAYSVPREDALRIADTIFIETGGCCECGGDLEVFLPDGTVLVPPQMECEPDLVAVRNGRALVQVVLTDGRWRVGIAEVTGEGSVRVVAPQLWDGGSASWTHTTDDPPGAG